MYHLRCAHADLSQKWFTPRQIPLPTSSFNFCKIQDNLNYSRFFREHDAKERNTYKVSQVGFVVASWYN